MLKLILRSIIRTKTCFVAWDPILCFAPRPPFGSWHAAKVMGWQPFSTLGCLVKYRAQLSRSIPALSPCHGARTKCFWSKNWGAVKFTVLNPYQFGHLESHGVFLRGGNHSKGGVIIGVDPLFRVHLGFFWFQAVIHETKSAPCRVP